MRLSDGTVVGICYGLSGGLAQLWRIFSTKDGARHLWPECKDVPRMLGWSLVYTLAVAAGIIALDWAFKGLDDHPDGGVHVNIAGLLAIAWAATALTGLAASGAYRLKQAKGVDVIAQTRLRTALTVAAIGMVLSGIYIFGSHLLRG